MRAVAVVTDRLVGLLVGVGLLKDRHRRAVEVRHIGVKHIGGDAVLRHQRLVGVAFGAQLRREQTEARRVGVHNVMRRVTVGANRHIRVLFAQQRRAVDAGRVLVMDGAVALRAGGGDALARFVRRLNLMRAVAVHTGCRVAVALGLGNGVDAELVVLKDIGVAILADRFLGQRIVARILGRGGRVGEGVALRGVAVHTLQRRIAHALHRARAMHRVQQGVGVHIQRNLLAGWQRQRVIQQAMTRLACSIRAGRGLVAVAGLAGRRVARPVGLRAQAAHHLFVHALHRDILAIVHVASLARAHRVGAHGVHRGDIVPAVTVGAGGQPCGILGQQVTGVVLIQRQVTLAAILRNVRLELGVGVGRVRLMGIEITFPIPMTVSAVDIGGSVRAVHRADQRL